MDELSHRSRRTIYGPYTEADLRTHFASGHIVATDMVRSDAMEQWRPVGQVLPALHPVDDVHGRGELTRAFPNPPDLPWWMTLVLGILTAGLFFVVWDLVEAVWMHRVRPSSRALGFYILATILFVLNLPGSYRSVMHAVFDGPPVDGPLGLLFGWGGFVVRLIARFSLRRSLLEHFNGPEPIGLRLSWFMTLVFGGLYFQYHFNRINRIKRASQRI